MIESNLFFAARIIFLLLFLLWLVSLKIKKVSIIDVFWGLGFVIVSWTTFFHWQPNGKRAGWVLAIVTIWGLRLAGYLAWRNTGKPEDYRYQEMRERIGRSFLWKSLFTVFFLQGALILIVSLPLQLSILNPEPLVWTDLSGTLLAVTGIFFEAVGDFQLAKFKSSPLNQGRVMNQGLWRYTRHPNYFGDFLVWWGFYFLALAGGGWWSVVSPLLMSFLLIRVSGVALLEKSLSQRTQGYQDYIRQTNAFFPWPPKGNKIR